VTGSDGQPDRIIKIRNVNYLLYI